MKPAEINAALKSIAAKSAIEEFWITDSSGHAYLTNTGIDFTFSPRSGQAAPGIGLLAADRRHQGRSSSRPRAKREIDNRVFKYVGVAGVDKPRIVQVGVGADHLPVCK